jgi:serine phosphatase RsbU (regulator of sigma subunit)
VATLSIIILFGVLSIVRIVLFGSHMPHVAVYGAMILIAYEIWVLRIVDRSLKAGLSLPRGFWALNVIVEMSAPAVGVAYFVSNQIHQDYRPLITVWVTLFFLLLILSTLRLQPLLSVGAGMIGAIGYLLAARLHGWHIKASLADTSIPHSAVPFFALMILAGGIVAAFVAREIRKHLEAALREAEAERQLKQVERDFTIARSIQQSLLPKVRPRINGYEVAGWNRSADATGGDYFDWKRLDDGRLVVTLADVTGHGIGPALLASVCRAYARASFRDSEPLALTVQRINESFGEDLSPGRFATFVAVICEPGSGKLELLSAGHGPLFWYSRFNQRLEEFAAHDVPLGIVPKLTVQCSQVLSMQEGDIIFLITDGFLEWENDAGEQFGSARFAEVVRASCNLSPEEIIAQLYKAVEDFAAGTPQQDDLTAVVIKRTAVAIPEFATAA